MSLSDLLHNKLFVETFLVLIFGSATVVFLLIRVKRSSISEDMKYLSNYEAIQKAKYARMDYEDKNWKKTLRTDLILLIILAAIYGLWYLIRFVVK